MASYIDVNEADFEAAVLKSDVPVLVDFWAPWCGPCRAISPVVEAIGEEYAGKVTVAKVNVDNNSEIAGKYEIRAIPTILIFKGGTVADTIVGLSSKEDLKAKIA